MFKAISKSLNIKRLIFISTLLLLPTFKLLAQKNSSTSDLAWYDIVVSHPISSKWSIYGEYGQRRINQIQDLNQQLFRSGVTRSFDSEIKLTIGVANFQNDISPSPSFKNRPEYRSFQFIEIEKTIGTIETELRFRIEQRWNQDANEDQLIDSFTFNHRIGYRVKAKVPIHFNAQTFDRFFAEIGNETMVNYGKEVGLNTFDQSRIYSGLLFKWSKKYSTQLTLMYLYQQKNNGFDFSKQYIIRFSQKITL